MRADDLHFINPADTPCLTRQWLIEAHHQLAPLIAEKRWPALLTDDMQDANGGPIDVFAHFEWDPEKLDNLLSNFYGISQTAQLLGEKSYVERRPPPWPGFQDVQIPVKNGLSLSGRIGYSTVNGQIRSADCIVILPGLFGDNGILRSRDLAIALRQQGHHVLGLEYRGHGQTEANYPHIPYTWGAMDSDDLVRVSRWLKNLPQVRRTGLVGFSWSAAHAILLGWYAGSTADDPGITTELRKKMPVVSAAHFQAGVVSISPVLRDEKLLDKLDTPRSLLNHPALGGLQRSVNQRVSRKGYPKIEGNLRKLIRIEYERIASRYPGMLADCMRFLRLLPYQEKPAGANLEKTPVSTLIVVGVTDPLKSAQDLADLLADVDNPNVAAVILPGGGHVGFPAYARSYYYSLLLNFFDPTRGPAKSAVRMTTEVADSVKNYNTTTERQNLVNSHHQKR